MAGFGVLHRNPKAGVAGCIARVAIRVATQAHELKIVATTNTVRENAT